MTATAHTSGLVLWNGRDANRAVLTTKVDMIDVTTLSPKPDPRWKAFDSRGHLHGFSSGPTRYPTLFEMGGDEASWFECRICRERVYPDAIAGPHRKTMPGKTEWTVAMELQPGASVPDVGEMGTVWFFSGDREEFGVAVVRRVYSNQSGAWLEVQGASALGKVAS